MWWVGVGTRGNSWTRGGGRMGPQGYDEEDLKSAPNGICKGKGLGVGWGMISEWGGVGLMTGCACFVL